MAERCEHGLTRYRSDGNAVAVADPDSGVTACCNVPATFSGDLLVCRCCRNHVVWTCDALAGIVRYQFTDR